MSVTAINLAVSWGICVLIWLVQVIIYPGFQRIPSDGFTDYHDWYVKRITAIVSPLMIVEAAAVVIWLVEVFSFYSIASAALIALVWLSTFIWQVPIHHRLKKGKEAALIRRLVATNWLRTVAWSVKALLAAAAVF